ncbi:response regulator transcription factor [Nocardia sp. 2]|uniref:Response regulator transcription factor n=1 Tax=Nocardia acididurans TaxID=2802282 RepID=A0ABS1M7C9_9NOCA|nr:response regulator transcription factor [Nocardia acididurans]MBL1076454.1 response regulator transcription factor [Nocardia acididurans]
MSVVRIVVADDQRLVREGLVVLLDAQPGFEVVGQATDGLEAVTAVEQLHPDIVLMDVRMPGVDGLEATRRIAATGSNARIIMLTTFDLDEYVYTALRLGASGFLLKDASAHLLAEAVRAVARGDAMLAPTVTRRLLGQFTRRPAAHRAADASRPTDLTARETEVLIHVARGLSNAEIAHELVISDQTVKTHVARILDKLRLRDRTQAAVYAYETGLVQPE